MKSDAQLKSNVAEELRWDPMVTSKDIDVTVHGGVVTLTGSVPHFAEKWAAEKATRRVDGVKTIIDELNVTPSGVHQRKDADIAAAVATSLGWHVWVPSDVHATVDDGWVKLTGKVSWSFQRTSAANAVSHLSGVKGVTNDITILPVALSSEVQGSIEDALERDAQIDAKQIHVTVDGSKVILTGKVRSWSEQEEAGTTAWCAPGVMQVQNDLVVTY